MAEAAFSEDGKYYSAISQDGRLRIWDTESNILKQEYTPDLHLSSPPVCLQWISVSHNSGPSQTQKGIVGDQEYQCIALGTSSGKILIYSVTQAKVETVLQEGKTSGINRSYVTALDWHRKCGLYSCNKENFVLEWDLHSGAVRNKYNVNIDSKNKQASSVSAIKLIPNRKKTPARFLVTASWQVRIWRLHNGDAEVIKCLGHNATPKALLAIATLNDTCWLIDGSQSERLLSFWDVTVTEEHLPIVNGDDTPNKKKKWKKSVSTAPTVSTPAYNFVLEDAPRQLDVCAGAADGGVRLSLAAATRSGVVHYYSHMLNGTSTKPIKPSVTIQAATAAAAPLPLQCARLAARDVILGYAHGAAVLFERITPDLKSKTQVLIRGEVAETKKKNKPNEVNKVRADASKDGVTYVEPMGGVSRKRVAPGGKVEVPMEQRLANLSVEPATRSAAVGQNLTKLLMQGLHSKDKRLILTVLQNNKWAVARQTVAALPADYVPQLLEQLAELASSRTSQCASACTWARAALRAHAALLLAAAAAHAPHVARMLAVFTHRRSHLCQLLNLKGRLELTMSQRESKDEAPTEHQPVLNYNDTSSDEEMEVEHNDSASEGGSDNLHWSASGGDSDSDSAD